MFNLYVVYAGHDTVTDVGKATTRRRKFKAPLVQKVQKMKDLPKTWVLTGKQFENFSPKKIKKIQFSLGEQNKGTTRPQRKKLNMNHVAKKE